MPAPHEHGHPVIFAVSPQVDCGRFRVKAVDGDEIRVTACIVRDGPDALIAVVRHKGPDDARWVETPMVPAPNDRWAATIRLSGLGRGRFTIQAWTDAFGTWRNDLTKRIGAGQDITPELFEGIALIEAVLPRIPKRSRATAQDAVVAMGAEPPRTGSADPRATAALDEDLHRLISTYAIRSDATTFKPVVEVAIERERARFGAWYEFFPRSTGGKRHGTFETAAKSLPRIAEMGFDVIYLPPIHPIGRTARKGSNNSLKASDQDVGVPWAIGSADGGHRSVHPGLGTVDDFELFVKEAAGLGLEVALDFAIQCSPDHPWVEQHPEWFHHRTDGTIRYAENPPKKYEDIYPINFDTEDREALWQELRSIVEFWIERGVRIFRVDNPHTKPFAFWEWLIREVQAQEPEVVFLAEAFTRPNVMATLAKLGFSQSYTYFTWRNTKHELVEYMTELAHTEMADFFRPNFFANTPDILHEYLQVGGPPAFKVRLVLAAMLSPAYGIYSGYELLENTPREENSEEYLHSEKYELRPREWTQEPNLSAYIARINAIRRKFSALRLLTNLHIHDIDKDQMFAFSKAVPGEDPILVVVNLNPFDPEEATLHLDLGVLGLDPERSFEVEDLITGATYVWNGPSNYVRLDPHEEPAHILRVKR